MYTSFRDYALIFIVSGMRKRIGSFASIIPNSLCKFDAFEKVSVFYHAVNNHPQDFNKGLYDTKSEKEFAQGVDYLLNQFGDKLELSFDDGLSCCYDIIAPILKEKGVQAIFFLNNAFIDNKELFYRYKAALIVNACRMDPSIYKLLNIELGSDPVSVVMRVGYKQRAKLDEIANRIGIDFDEYLREQKPYMNDAQVRSLIKDGFLIGAHSVDHPPFYELDLKEQLWQVETSVNTLIQQYQLSYRYFSFPFTDWNCSMELFKIISERNLLDRSWGCAGMKLENFTFHKQRLALDVNNQTAEETIKSEWILYQLKRIIGKHKITRN